MTFQQSTRFWLAVVMLIIALGDVRAQDETTIAKSARTLLDRFHGKERTSPRKLHLIYFTPQDTEAAENWQPRVARTMEHIREFYAKEMTRHGLSATSLPLDYHQGKLVVHFVRGKRPFSEYHMQSGSAIREEARAVLAEKGIKIDQETILLFCNLTTVTDKTVRHNSPYYAGGTARGGTAWLCDSKFLDPALLAKKEPMLTDGQYGKVSLGRYNSIFVGGTAHELGHALGLPHNRENKADRRLGTSLMGSGNHTYGQELRGEGKGSFLPLADALRLASHPFFSGSDKDLRTPVKASFRDLSFEPGAKEFVVRGKVESSLPCHAVVAYLDPAGGGDYDAHSAVAAVDADGGFTLPCRDLVAGRPAELRILACFVNGATHTQRFNFKVTPEGRPDLDNIRIAMLTRPALSAWKAGDRAGFDAAAKAISAKLDKQDRVVVWLRQLGETLGPPPHAAPSTIAESIKEISLPDCAWTRAHVGWNNPLRNQVPADDVFLAVGGERFARGLYAHAPASHEWDLGGKWQRLQGAAGIQDGNTGTVVFVVKADGAERWRSPLVKAGKAVSFDVDIKGAKQLQLIVENGGDGNGSDWGVWLEPRLTR